ncbi:MAG: hypothetical protein HDS14_00405 [Bacteroides sp.]|nr:hypothetical protein [Bacteroides sp.]
MARRKRTSRTTAAKPVNKKFNSLAEFAEYLDTAPLGPGWYESLLHSKATYPDYVEFSGTKDYTEANNMMLNGWDYGKEEVTKIMNDRFDGVQEVKRLTLSYVGAVPCVPAYLSGSPRNMIAIKKQSARRPVVTIVYNAAVGGSVEASDIMTTAAKLFNVIRGLELGGVSVELYAGSFSVSGNDNVNLLVKVKSASQPLNLLTMCYPVVHPSFNRRHKFAFIERSGLSCENWGDYGGSLTDIAEMTKRASALGLTNPNCFSFYNLQYKTEKQIAEMIR